MGEALPLFITFPKLAVDSDIDCIRLQVFFPDLDRKVIPPMSDGDNGLAMIRGTFFK